MKRAGLILAASLVVVGLWWAWRTRPPASLAPLPERVASGVVESVSSTAPRPTGSNAAPLLGESILRGYGAPASPPANDLNLMARLLDNFQLVVKQAASRPLSANGDWADALRGRNPAHERFLPDRHNAFNAQGQLVDRWGTPLFFHALGGGRFDLRSAGPDRQLWTDDDLHRNADGSFRHGTNLNPASLFAPPPRR